jgi:hypothetical protein
MAGVTPLQQIALLGLVLLSSLTLLFSIGNVRQKLHLRRRARLAVWWAGAGLLLLFFVAFGFMSNFDEGMPGGGGGAQSAPHH